MINKEPPLVLVRTWYEMLTQSDSAEAVKRAEKMLVGAFGTKEAVAEYLRKHRLID